MLKKGKCVNIGLPCSKALKKEIQEVDSLNFICPECGQPLVEVVGIGGNKGQKGTNEPKNPRDFVHEPPKTFLQKYGKVIGIGVGVLAIAGGAYAFLGGGSDTLETVSAERISLSKSTGTLVIGDHDTLSVAISPEESSPTLFWASSNTDVLTVENGVVTAVGEGTASVGVRVQENKDIKAFCKYTITAKSESVAESSEIQETVKKSNESKKTIEPKQTTPARDVDNVTDMTVANGKYSGPVKNGKPHGFGGRLVFTRTAVINNSDIKKRTASPGEYIQGQFVNGVFTIGKHYDANGNLIESLNFGVAN